MKTFSKWRNIFGEAQKATFSDIKRIENNVEGSLIDVNTNFMAISWQGLHGCVAILDSSKPDRTPSNLPLIRAHDLFVSNVKFSPYRPNLLCTCSDDATIKLWDIPEGGLTEDLTVELQKYSEHTKRTILTEFHPTCQDVMVSASNDMSIHTWNMIKAESISKVSIGEVPTGLTWNRNGSLVAACSKEKTFIIDPRANSITLTVNSHTSTRPSKAHFIDDNYFVSVGGTKSNKKEAKLFDIRKSADGVLSEESGKVDFESKSTYFWSFYDETLKLLYVAGKGEGSVSIFDLNDEKIIPCTSYLGDIRTSICAFPKKLNDYNRLEVMKFAQICKNSVQYFSFFVPRKVKAYDPAIYPPCFCGEQALDYDSWVAGQNVDPIVKEINTIESKWVSEPIKFEKKVEEVKLTVEEELAQAKEKIKALEAENAELKAKLAAAGIE